MAADKSFGVYLIENNVISQEAYLEASAFTKSNSISLPQLCMERGVLDEASVVRIREAAFRTNKSWVQAALDTKAIDAPQLEKMQQLQSYKKITIEDALVKLELASDDLLDKYRDKYEDEYGQDAFSDLDIDIGESTDSDVITEVFKTCTDFFVRPDKDGEPKTYAPEKKVNAKALPHCVSQKFLGQLDFTFYVFSSAKLWLALTEEFYMLPFEDYDEDAEESSKEIINTVYGNACCRLSQKGIEETLEPAIYHKTEHLFGLGKPKINLFPRIADYQAGFIIH